MRTLRFGTISVVTIGVVTLGAELRAGQAPSSTARPASASAAKTSAPRTAWGSPNLQGIWDFRTVTPMERPPEFAGKAVLTEQEAAEYERRTVESRNADSRRDTATRRIVNGTAETEDVALAYNDFWWDRGTRVIGSRRTSLIVDPPDGRLPPLTAEGRKRAEGAEARQERPAHGPEDRSVGERCILGFNSGPPMAPGGYNMNVQIFQTPDHVVLLNEMVHNARIVPLDGRPHGKVRQWVGDSRGRWEGDTLVVETTSFYQNTSLRGSSPNLRLTERFTRVDNDTLLYEYTVNDPSTWTRPWTVQIPMVKTAGPIYEYACHEGNYGMTGLLSGARAVEQKTTQEAVKKQSSR
jgi:hypothetical protein